jgi:iron complex transport system substrate-binding protein
VPKGNSFAATYLVDAGADYLWSDEPGTGNLPLDFEAVFDRAAAADVWLHPGAARSIAELTERDPRLANFEAWKNAEVWNRDAKVLENGANDYWESGIVRPDLVLEDLIQILHNPDAPQRLNYYRRLL